ncbi:hypothetical protein ACFSJU_14750 [Paradesertivirga mongoliensis]|uniref:Uncharacterized protein n=1 Tax=Paradesertivirga mongoliensis TaxID=2100740 RepID=A0ABW4ZQ15_9SPHI|nr:hypothetical protein [Pedobacter mongoliensis]
MEEQQYIDYFENLCRQSLDINHEVDGKKAFFYLDNPDNTDEIDNAFRNQIQYPAFILDAPAGMVSGNGSANYTDSPVGSFTVLCQAKTPEEVRQARDRSKSIGISFLARMNKDARENKIVAGKRINFVINDNAYEPMNFPAHQLYGYVFEFLFVCPFGFSSDSGTWRDI